MSLITTTKEITELENQIKEENTRHKDALSKLKSDLVVKKKKLSVCNAGLDHEKISLARKYFDFRGDPTISRKGNSSVNTKRKDATKEAIQVISESVTPLEKEYIGVKNYSGFGDQGSDHPYGLGPRHGNIVFSIGRVRSSKDEELSEEVREAAIYFLLNWAEIFKAESDEKAA